jgi:hypothetical protein
MGQVSVMKRRRVALVLGEAAKGSMGWRARSVEDSAGVGRAVVVVRVAVRAQEAAKPAMRINRMGRIVDRWICKRDRLRIVPPGCRRRIRAMLRET